MGATVGEGVMHAVGVMVMHQEWVVGATVLIGCNVPYLLPCSRGYGYA